jgi:Bacterial Ig-like domain (group 2)
MAGTTLWRRGLWTAVFLTSAITIAAISSGGSIAAASPHATLEYISVSPSSQTITAGSVQDFVATGIYSDGTNATLSNVKWSSSDAAVASVSNKRVTKGLATGQSGGATNITASFKHVSGSASLTVEPGTETFASTGTFVVPPSITTFVVTVLGGGGLAGPVAGIGGPGGAGASVNVRITIPRSIHSLAVVVGQGGIGESPDSGGGGGSSDFGAGGSGFYAGGGGGASGIFVGTPDRADALVVAGGGGGEITINPVESVGGNGGTLSPGGDGGAGVAGDGATDAAAGAGGAAIELAGFPPVLAPGGQAGAGPNGGNGGGLAPGTSNSCGQGGGGGGGGYFGGGGGGYCGGGGGGSSFVASRPVSHATATLLGASVGPDANGSVTITWG